MTLLSAEVFCLQEPPVSKDGLLRLAYREDIPWQEEGLTVDGRRILVYQGRSGMRWYRYVDAEGHDT